MRADAVELADVADVVEGVTHSDWSWAAGRLTPVTISAVGCSTWRHRLSSRKKNSSSAWL